jgi:HlyD family secretion protein
MNTTTNAETVKSLVMAHGRAAGRQRFARWLVVPAALVTAALAYGYQRAGSSASAVTYETAEVTRGNLVATVSATGSLQPTNEVEVGSELSGIVEAVYVEENDHVEAGQVLARLDVSKLTDQRNKSAANLTSSKAKLAQADATVIEATANLNRLREVLRLSGGKVPSAAELEAAEATLARAEADRASAQAAIVEAEAALRSDETNLSKASIRSPIDGIILSRQIEPGQTVAASLQAPTLFTVAEDLTEMELEVDVDEASVGRVEAGQAASFTVDAYPDRKYTATVSRVAYGSETTNGVVTYPTLLTLRNTDLTLRPGMTATARIATAARQNAVLVPNAALRFTPDTGSAAAQSRSGLVASLMPRPPNRENQAKVVTSSEAGAKEVWIARDGAAVSIPLTVGVTDGRFSEVTSGEVAPGMQVIVESVAKS